jgi:hypothetical protein
MGCYVPIEIALRDRVPQERPVTIPRYMRQSPGRLKMLRDMKNCYAASILSRRAEAPGLM